MKYARDNNAGKEVAFVFRKGLTGRTEYIGGDDSLDFGTALLGKGNDIFIMHNHPRNSGFSEFDIAEFVATDSIKTLSIVKNSGKLELITKLPDYNKRNVIIERKREKNRCVVYGTDKEYAQYIKNLLEKLDKKGFVEWKK